MAKNIEQLIQKIGFSPKEQVVYLAALELGEAPVSSIAKKAHTDRSTTYDILKSLAEKGLATKVEHGKILTFSTTGVENLETFIQSQKIDWEERLASFRQLEPELRSLLGSANAKPVVRFYEGKMGVKNAFLDQVRGNHREVLSFSVPSKIQRFFGDSFLKTYTGAKTRGGTISRAIVPREDAVAKYIDKYYGKIKNRFSIKMVSKKDFPFEAEMNIYDNKISLMTLDEKRPVAIIIESPDLAKSQRLIFELLWKRL